MTRATILSLAFVLVCGLGLSLFIWGYNSDEATAERRAVAMEEAHVDRVINLVNQEISSLGGFERPYGFSPGEQFVVNGDHGSVFVHVRGERVKVYFEVEKDKVRIGCRRDGKVVGFRDDPQLAHLFSVGGRCPVVVPSR